jgi:hypothetical protein
MAPHFVQRKSSRVARQMDVSRRSISFLQKGCRALRQGYALVPGHPPSATDHRHRRLLQDADRRALHALVPARRLLPHVPHPWASPQGALRLAVERAARRSFALPLDAVHLFAGLEGHQPGLHDHAAAGVRLPGRRNGLRHQGPVHVRAGAAGQFRNRPRACRRIVAAISTAVHESSSPGLVGFAT